MKKFLLHTCCTPCSIAIIDELKDNYNLSVFFYNPNIYPEEEYLKRKKYVVQVCEDWQVPMVDRDHEIEKWHEAVKGLEAEPEMGTRCPVCFRLRLNETAAYAAEYGFDIFSTSLTSGRTKRAQVINPIGEMLAKEYGLEYLAEDWKKGGRQEKGQQMVRDRGIYRQDYCGCKYSLRDRNKNPR